MSASTHTPSADAERVEVTRDQTIAFMDEAFRNIDIGFNENEVREIEGALQSFATRLATSSASTGAGEPVAWVSPGQLAALPADPDDAGGAAYLPIRHTSAGNFIQPLYAALTHPSPEPANIRARAIAIVQEEAREMGYMEEDVADFQNPDGDDALAVQAVERVLRATSSEPAAPSDIGVVGVPRETLEGLRGLRGELARIAALSPNDQPRYANGFRPFSTGDLRHYGETLDSTLAMLTAAPAPEHPTTGAVSGEVELAYYWRTTCICTAAQRHMADCPEHGAALPSTSTTENGQ